MFVPLALALLLTAKPPPDPRQDLLDAMVAEITRNQAELKLRENRGPYFIGYQLKDYDSREVVARYGAVFQDATTHDRKISVDVRVGDYAFDSSVGDDLDFTFSLKGASYLTRKSAPLDDSPAALRTALWLVTDEKYKAALFNYLKKKGEDVYVVEDPTRSPSFSKESPEVQVVGRVPFAWSHERWVAFARDVSARLANEKAFFDSEVRVTGDKIVRSFVTTEGTRLVTEDTLYGVHVQAWTRADDGQLLEDSRDFYAPLEEQLPAETALRRTSRR